MSTETAVLHPEVLAFVAAVRAHLADVDEDERREILDGLEADLHELVSERGLDALGDPAAYARELRLAAGLDPTVARGRGRTIGAAVEHLLDAGRDRTEAVLDRLPADTRPLLAWLRPGWWLLRAWVAVGLLDAVTGLGLLPLLVAVPLSVQIGRGRLWPGSVPQGRGLRGRVLLLGLNGFAVAMLPVAIAAAGTHGYSDYDLGFDNGYQAAASAQGEDGPKAGIYVDGEWVSNIYPYDAQGRPLLGVQLFNQVGDPINVVTQPEYDIAEIDDQGEMVDGSVPVDPETGQQLPRVFYPWSNGAAQLFNVFPLASRVQQGEEPSPTAFADEVKPKVGAFPKALVPPVQLPGILTGAR